MHAGRILPAAFLSMLIGLGLCAGLARAEDGLWTTDFAAAKAKAKVEKKLLLVDFTGSDWCVWCKKLHAEVFDKDAFQTEAPKQYVLVELDYPRADILSDDLKAQNKKLAKEYKIRGYPTVLLLDAEGQVIAHTGYKPNGPVKYLAQLDEFCKIYEGVLKMKAALENAQGLDRAKLLDRLIAAYDKLNNPTDKLPAWTKEIIALDAGNKAGLKNKYECRVLIAEAQQLGAKKKYAEAIAVFDKALAISGITDQQKQDICFTQSGYHNRTGNLSAGLACLKKALEAAPQGDKAEQIEATIKNLAPAVEALEYIAKNRDAVEKATGLERAKLLDQLLDANQKIARYGMTKIRPADIAKWRKEIVELDADNKAGLKNKQQFITLLRDAERLGGQRDFDEAQAALDKALALAGIAAEQIQQGLTIKAEYYLEDNNSAKALDLLNRALKAAPEGQLVPIIKSMLDRAEQEAKKAAKPASTAAAHR